MHPFLCLTSIIYTSLFTITKINEKKKEKMTILEQFKFTEHIITQMIFSLKVGNFWITRN